MSINIKSFSNIETIESFLKFLRCIQYSDRVNASKLASFFLFLESTGANSSETDPADVLPRILNE